LICAAPGGLPDTTRVFSTVMAAEPAPPATAPSFQVNPSFATRSFRTFTAAASPPDVHQWTTSTVPLLSAASAGKGNNEARETTVTKRVMVFMGAPFLVFIHAA